MSIAPINMRSHGHGQGYLDLNFLIPELIERVDYAKRPYAADAGDFPAAGTVRFYTADALPRPIAEVTLGSFGYARALAAGSGTIGDGTLLLALDGSMSNGPWVLDDDLRRIAGLAKYSQGDAATSWSLKAEGYDSRWTSTDQVPLRAIASGAIPRFGFIDPALGGHTTRLNLTGQ